MYIKNAILLTFSEIGFAPSTIAAMAYQTATCAETFICCDECPMAHHTALYINGSILLTIPSDHNNVGIKIMAPDAIVKTAIIAAVNAPKVTSGIEPW